MPVNSRISYRLPCTVEISAGNAVVRNRIRRRLKESVRVHAAGDQGHHPRLRDRGDRAGGAAVDLAGA